MNISLAELARHLDAELRGDGEQMISGVATLAGAGASDVSFLANNSYRSQLLDSKAGAVIVRPELADSVANAALVVVNPYLAFARTTQLFDNRPILSSGIHPSAVVAATASIGRDVKIAANVVIGEHVILGDQCEIGAGSVIDDHCQLGVGCRLSANVSLYHDVTLGDHVRIHSGAVLGADGFGFAPNQGRWEKIAQLGGVRVGNNTEIGANTCIDRGALDDTVIGDDVILDNQIQIAHNVRIGDGCAIAACTGIAGSTRLGRNCTIAGGVGIAGHLTIGDRAHIAAAALITQSIGDGEMYGSGTSQMPLNEWKRSATRFRQLDSLAKRLQKLEKSQQGKA